MCIDNDNDKIHTSIYISVGGKLIESWLWHDSFIEESLLIEKGWSSHFCINNDFNERKQSLAIMYVMMAAYLPPSLVYVNKPFIC